ncbi:hypothetical protein AB205_0139640, partial [Aquarana catesbeiana]
LGAIIGAFKTLGILLEHVPNTMVKQFRGPSGGNGGAREGVTDAIEPREEAALAAALPDKVPWAWVREDEEDKDGLVIHSTKSSACCGSTRPAAEKKDVHTVQRTQYTNCKYCSCLPVVLIGSEEH